MHPHHRFQIAPMIDWTDRHERYFLRLITKRALLYTEMITTHAIIHGDKNRLLDFSAEEHPVALQLGGNDPTALAHCTKIADEWDYDEINLNVGCPSDRVQQGAFGACLMREPQLIAECVSAMQAATNKSITIKCRLGVDEQNPQDTLPSFIETVAKAGCKIFILHARKAWLKGLSPKENRTVPPLDYELVFQIKKMFPELTIILNGGITDIEQGVKYLDKLDGVMLGRESYHNPYALSVVDALYFSETNKSLDRYKILKTYCAYMEQQLTRGVPLHCMTRHILGLYKGQANGKLWRRFISEQLSHQAEPLAALLAFASKIT